jgi:hypothetical protein
LQLTSGLKHIRAPADKKAVRFWRLPRFDFAETPKRTAFIYSKPNRVY